MNIRESIFRFRALRKIRRSKPHVWHLPELNAAYIQNYKVGTRSLRLALSERLDRMEGGHGGYEQMSDEVTEKFDKKYSEFVPPENLTSHLEGLFTFGFVRNPIDRLYSCYANKIADIRGTNKRNPFRQHGVTTDHTFSEFVEIVSEIPDQDSERHFRSQHCFMAYQGALVTDFLGKLENFSSDWNVLREKFDFAELPHQNQSSLQKAHYADFYTPHTWKLALRRYQEDIELFGYGEILLKDRRH